MPVVLCCSVTGALSWPAFSGQVVVENWWQRATGFLKSPAKRWFVLACAGVPAAIWLSLLLSSVHSNYQGVRRWQAGGAALETEAFREYINHKGNASSQPRALGHLASQVPALERGNPAGPIDPRPNPDWAFPHVSVYSVPNIQPPHPQPTLRDLGDHGQARAIEFLERSAWQGSHSWDDLRKALSGEDQQPGEKDPFLFERVLVASVTKGAEWQLGDRMVWTRTFVQPINFKFSAYTIAATESETVKVSSVESTNVRKLSADLGLTVPGLEGPKISIGPSRENTVKTTSDVATQYERLGVDIMPQFLRIVRESVAGGDVLGNTRIALSIVTDPSLIQKTFPEDKQYDPLAADIDLVVTSFRVANEDEAATKTVIEVVPQVPLPHCALRARVWALYEQRHVDGGYEYYDESRQRVVFIRGVDEKTDVDIIGADDVSPTVWRIQFVPKGERPSNEWRGKTFLKAYLENGEHRDLVFSDYGKAAKVARWVRTNPGEQTGNGLHFNYAVAEAQVGVGLVVLKKLGDDCASGEKFNDVILVRGR